ncbi:MAG: PQQ-dependent sugar dehydrogenase [Caldilineaceae bacterium]|nr:PQQ-dependent sugar dehydrogenase [Caldilineaceae bacterium]
MKSLRLLLGLASLFGGLAACSFSGLPSVTLPRAATATPEQIVAATATLLTPATPTSLGASPITATVPLTTITPATTTAALTPTTPATDSAVRILVPTATPAPAATVALAVPPADAASARLQVPEGFAVRIFAQGIGTPRLMTVGPDGLLYVADIDGNRVVRLPDTDGDGVADALAIVVEDLAGAHSVEWFEDWLYVAGSNQIERMQDADGDGIFESREAIADLPAPVGHRTRTLHFGPDGKLYVTAGSSGNNEPESDPRRAAIMRLNPDGSIPDDNPFVADRNAQRHPLWAEGLRNSVDFLFLPDGRLWANHNGSDMLGDDLPPEEIVIEVTRGQHYGWPYCYTPTLGATPPNTVEVRDERVALNPALLPDCSQAVPARFTDLAHQAPLGMAQYNATAFPAAYQGNLFVAYHGSWNSTAPRDCKVQMIVVREGAPVESQPFLTGFRDSETENCGRAWGRPAGVAVGVNGELFVSDDQNGNIYRIVYTGP